MNKVTGLEKLDTEIKRLRKQITDLANAIDRGSFCNPGLIAASLRTIVQRKRTSKK